MLTDKAEEEQQESSKPDVVQRAPIATPVANEGDGGGWTTTGKGRKGRRERSKAGKDTGTRTDTHQPVTRGSPKQPERKHTVAAPSDKHAGC